MTDETCWNCDGLGSYREDGCKICNDTGLLPEGSKEEMLEAMGWGKSFYERGEQR